MQILKIQSRLRDSLAANRTKLQYLILMWEKQMEKLRMYYMKKNKNKTHTGLIIALNHIPPATRDQLLMKYIQQCKLTHALSFF